MTVRTDERRVTEKGAEQGYVLAPGEGERLAAAGIELTFKALAGDTHGKMLVGEYVAPPNFPGPPAHWHRETVEVFYGLEGRVTITVGEKQVEVEPGTVVYLPTGVPHSFANETEEPARFLFLATPAGLGEYFFKVGELVATEPKWPPEDPEKRQQIGALARQSDQLPPDTAPEGARKPVVHRPGTGQPISLRGSTLNFVTDDENSGEKLTTLIYEGAADVQGPPPHYHKETAEVIYMLEGTISVEMAGRQMVADPGSFVYIPPNVVHSWSNSGGEPVKFLGFGLPAGLEGYFKEMKAVLEEGPPDMSRVAALGERYDQYLVEKPG